MPVGIGKCPPGAMSAASTGNDWLTPPSLLEALGAIERDADEPSGWRLSRTPFTTDPCASRNQPWPTARVMWDEDADGTSREWKGDVWLNSPHGSELYAWVARLAAHGNGIALLYARTDTVGFHAHVWAKADAVFFFSGRPWFHIPVCGLRAPANCGGPMCCAIYGERSMRRVKRLLRRGSLYPGVLVPSAGANTKRSRGGLKAMATKLEDLKAVTYVLPSGRDDANPVTLERVGQLDGPDRWAIRWSRYCLTRKGKWEYESMPSSRTKTFFARCRFATAEAALAAWDTLTDDAKAGRERR